MADKLGIGATYRQMDHASGEAVPVAIRGLSRSNGISLSAGGVPQPCRTERPRCAVQFDSTMSAVSLSSAASSP
jgi:hypothetical protein